jgi:hypothetical protein
MVVFGGQSAPYSRLKSFSIETERSVFSCFCLRLLCETMNLIDIDVYLIYLWSMWISS